MRSTNLALELLSLAITIVFCSSMPFRVQFKNRQSALVLQLVISNAVLLLSLIVHVAIDGNSAWKAVNYMIGILSFSAGWIFSCLFAAQVVLLLNDVQAVSPKVIRYLRMLCLGILLCILLSPLWEALFYIDSAGYYHRGSVHEVRFVFQVMVFLIPVALLIPRLKLADSNIIGSVVAYGVLMMAGIVLEQGIPGLKLAGVTQTVMLAIAFLLHQTSLTKTVMRQRDELAEKRIAIMVSQIQPHFLYNAMTTIRYFCWVNPVRAAELIDDFSRYIRNNMDALTKSSPVLLQQEIAHTKTYMAIEQCRFPGIRVEYDIRDDLFRIPSLSVQPLVENAVKYGMSRDRHTLRIRISAWTDAGGHYVSVEDNGVGFDVTLPLAPERSHIGIANARARIEEMVGGQLEIISQPGEGTTAMITIPLKGGI